MSFGIAESEESVLCDFCKNAHGSAWAFFVCSGRRILPRARFDSVESKLLSALLTHPRLLTGPQCSLSNPFPETNSKTPARMR